MPLAFSPISLLMQILLLPFYLWLFLEDTFVLAMVRRDMLLAFSLGTRNSYVVLPLAMALPPGYELAVVAIVFQSLVELIAMAIFLW